MNKSSFNITERILREYLVGGLDHETEELVQGWIKNEENFDAKDEELKKKFFDHVTPDKKPGRQTFEALRKIHEILGFPEKSANRVPLRRRLGFRIAAAFIPFFIIGGAIILHKRGPIENMKNYTGDSVLLVSDAGSERKKIVLPDGSEIWLSENSMVEYPADFLENRTVNLWGEAYFAVKKNEKSPFRVNTGGLTVSVLGTEFLMRTDTGHGQTEVALATGKVSVSHESSDVVHELSPLEQLLIHNETLEVEKNLVTLDYIMSHKTTEPLTSRFLTLGEVLDRIASAYNVGFDIGDGIPLDFMMRIEVDDTLPLDELLTIIQTITTPSFDFRIRGDNVTITRK